MNTVRVMIRAKVGGKYPYLPAVVNGNGRIKPGVALVGGGERKVQGSYHLRFTEGGHRRWKSVGDDAGDAMTAARKVEATLKAKALGVAVNPFFPDMPTKRIKLADAIAEYKTEVKEHKAKGTYDAYSCALKLFVKNCHKTFVDEVDRSCMLAFAAALKKSGYAERTVASRFGYVYTFVKRNGKAGILGKTDWPKYEETESEIYSEEDVKKMLGACRTHAERTLILFVSGTGFRHGENSHAEIDDIKFSDGTIQTRSKPHWSFTTKDHEQRIVPVSDSLLEGVKKHSKTVEGPLLFPTKNGKPDKHLDRIVVRIAKRAGVTVPKKPMHAFRAVYATRLLRNGVDIYTIQKFLGHGTLKQQSVICAPLSGMTRNCGSRSTQRRFRGSDIESYSGNRSF